MRKCVKISDLYVLVGRDKKYYPCMVYISTDILFDRCVFYDYEMYFLLSRILLL